MGVDSSVPVTGTAVFGQLGQGLFEHTGISRIAVIPQQIGILGVTKAFVRFPAFLSCSATWQVATEPGREPRWQGSSQEGDGPGSASDGQQREGHIPPVC